MNLSQAPWLQNLLPPRPSVSQPVPIVDARRRLVGMVTQTDPVAALYEICLARLDAGHPAAA